MRVLFLGPESSGVLRYLREIEQVTQTAEPLRELGDYEFFVSHGYRHIIARDLCAALDGRAVNLHISYLPWNRGADPNLWSHVEGTPCGVSIHYIAPGLDTGDLIAQRLVDFAPGDTLATSYEKLQAAIADLFAQRWPAIKAGSCARIAQSGDGSYHRSADKERIAHLLARGWDTPIAALRPQ